MQLTALWAHIEKHILLQSCTQFAQTLSYTHYSAQTQGDNPSSLAERHRYLFCPLAISDFSPISLIWCIVFTCSPRPINEQYRSSLREALANPSAVWSWQWTADTLE